MRFPADVRNAIGFQLRRQRPYYWTSDVDVETSRSYSWQRGEHRALAAQERWVLAEDQQSRHCVGWHALKGVVGDIQPHARRRLRPCHPLPCCMKMCGLKQPV